MSDRLGCKHCNFKGYVKYAFNSSSEEDEGSVSVSICSHCKDARGYYAYVRNKYGTPTKEDNILKLADPEPLAKVLDFNEFKQRKDKNEED